MKTLSVIASTFMLLAGLVSCSDSDSNNDLDSNYGFEESMVRYEIKLSGNYENYTRLAALAGTNNDLDTLYVDNDNITESNELTPGVWTFSTDSNTPDAEEVYAFSDGVIASSLALTYNDGVDDGGEVDIELSCYVDDKLEQDTSFTFSGLKIINISAPNGTIIVSEDSKAL